MNIVEGVVVNVNQQITKQRRKTLYVIADYKNPDGSVKRYILHIKSVVSGPVLVSVPVNLLSTAPLLTSTKTTIFPDYPSTSVPANTSSNFASAPVPTTTNTTVAPALFTTIPTVPENLPTIVAPETDPKITTTIPYNPPTPVVPETDTTTTTWVYSNTHIQNVPVPYKNPPPTIVSPVPDTPSPTTSTPAVVADGHGVNSYYSKYLIYLDEVTSLQWNFTNQFGDTVYPNSGVWMYRIYTWLMMYGKKTFSSLFDNTNLELLSQDMIPFKDMSKALRFQGVVKLATIF